MGKKKSSHVFPTRITLFLKLDLNHQEKKQRRGGKKKAMWVIFGKWCVCLVLVAALLVGGVIPGRWMQPLS